MSVGHLTESTNCPENNWVYDFLRSDSRHGVKRTAVVVSVGCNKAYDAINTLNLFRQEVLVTMQQWHNATQFECGVCSQCHGTNQVVMKGIRARPVEVYCIEPLPANFNRLNATATRFQLHSYGFRSFNSAVTSEQDAQARGWTAQFPVNTGLPGERDLLGWEAIGIGVGVDEGCPRCKMVDVPLVVLDRFVQSHNLSVIDYLSIDTEGNDPNVLLGATSALALVRYFEFEYHRVGVWLQSSLRQIIQQLKTHDFVCYWIGRGKVWRLTD
eukprot:EG_transcript_23337